MLAQPCSCSSIQTTKDFQAYEISFIERTRLRAHEGQWIQDQAVFGMGVLSSLA